MGNEFEKTRAHPSPDAKRTIGHYELLEKIGGGGMGVVYRAVNQNLNKEVALKLVLPLKLEANERMLARFYREMRAVGQLEHPHIVRAIDAGHADSQHYLVLELLDGQDVANVIRSNNQLAVADAAELVLQAAQGLVCIHEHGMVHRDIKPSNLMLTLDGCVKILDLGLASLRDDDEDRLTSTGATIGTFDFMSPEQAEDSASLDIRSDVYSLGCTFYYCLVGHAPFAHIKTPLKKVQAHVHEPVPPLSEGRSDVPVQLDGFLRSMLAKDPAGRPQTPQEIVEFLTDFATGANLSQLAARATEYRQQHESSGSVSTRSFALHEQGSTRETRSMKESTRPANDSLSTPQNKPWIRYGVGLVIVGALLLAASGIYWTSLQNEQPRTTWMKAHGLYPERVIWPGHTGDADESFVVQKDRLELTCREPQLIQLGVMENGCEQEMEVEVEFHSRPAEFGIFLNYRVETTDGKEMAHFHLIRLYNVGGSSSATTSVRRAQTALNLDGTLWDPKQRTEYDVPFNLRRKLLLKIEPSNHIRVHLDGLPLDAVSSDAVHTGLGSMSFVEKLPWGVYNSGGTVWVRKVQIR